VTKRIVRRHCAIIRLGHSRDNPRFHDPAGVTEIRLQDGRRFLLQDFAKAPFRENPFAGRDGRCVSRAISAIISTFWHCTGSSMNIGRYGSSALINTFAFCGLMAPWKSIAISTSFPPASRRAANASVAHR